MMSPALVVLAGWLCAGEAPVSLVPVADPVGSTTDAPVGGPGMEEDAEGSPAAGVDDRDAAGEGLDADEEEPRPKLKKKKKRSSGGTDWTTMALSAGLGWAVGLLCGAVGCLALEVIGVVLVQVAVVLFWVLIYVVYLVLLFAICAAGGNLLMAPSPGPVTRTAGAMNERNVPWLAAWALMLATAVGASAVAPLVAATVAGALGGGAGAAVSALVDVGLEPTE